LLKSLSRSTFSTPSFTRSPLSFSRSYAMGLAASKEAAIPQITGDKLLLTFACPHETIHFYKEIEMVIVPGINGEFGVLKHHVPTVSELKPGTVKVIHKDGTQEKYFVSGGFAFVKKDCTVNVNVLEAFTYDKLDPEAARDGYRKWTGELAKSTTDQDKAKAMIALEVYHTMCGALGVAT